MSLPILLVPTLLAASSGLWVAGPAAGTCGERELIVALGELRPGLRLRSGLAPAGSDEPQIMLEHSPGLFTVRITGDGEPLVRSFVDPQDCASAGRTAALIVDRALDAIPLATAPPDLRGFTPSSWLQLAVAAGGGVEQGPLNWSPAVDVEGVVHLGVGEILMAVDVIPYASRSLGLASSAAAYVATSVEGEVGGGVAPRLGPGRLALDGAIGEALAFVSLSGVPAGQPYYQQQTQSVAEPFGAVRLGYSVDLPRGLFLGIRAEERLAFARATLSIEGTNDSVSTRAWTFDAGALLGWRFY